MARDLKAQLEIAADASGVETGIGKAKRSIASLGAAAAQAGKEASKGLEAVGDGSGTAVAKVDAATRNIIGSIQRQTAALEAGSRSGADYFRVLAQQRGIDPAVLQPYLAQLEAVTRKTREAQTATVDFSKVTTSLGATGFSKSLAGATSSLGATSFGQALAEPAKQATEAIKSTGAAATVSGKQLNAYGQTAAQTAAALRQVPAQLTDIVTSLQAGQAPLTVLLQQGGQLKDQFGGVVPAARALGGAVAGLVNPFTIAGAAVVALGVAYKQGSEESDAFARALILSGNATGATVGQLQVLARNVSAVAGTQADAAEAITALAATGKVASANLERFALAAVRLERDAGRAVSETVKDFAELGKDPVAASQRLNEQYNYLTQAVFEQIKALQEQGRVAEAAGIAQTAFADRAISNADKLTQQLGYLQQAWRGVKDFASGAWDAMLNVGRASTPETRLDDLRKQLDARIARGPVNDVPGVVAAFERGNKALRDQIAELEGVTRETQRLAGAQAEQARTQKAGIAAAEEIDRIRKASLSNQEKLNAELKKYRDNIDAVRRANPSSELLNPERIAKDEANIRERFKDPAARAVRDDAATRLLQQLRETEASLRAQLSTEDRLTESEKKRAEFVQQIADLKTKSVLTAEQKSLLANEAGIKAQLDKNVQIEREVEARKEATKELEKQARALEQFRDRAAALTGDAERANRNRRDEVDSTVAGFGLGNRGREKLRAQTQINREFEDRLSRLSSAVDPAQLLVNPEYLRAFEQAQQQIKQGQADAIADLEIGYARISSAQERWSNGATDAFKNYIDQARDVAAQTERLFTDAFGGLEDALVEFVKTGKLNFNDLADSVVADITRIIVKQQIANAAASLLGATGGNDGVVGQFLGALLGGRASGGPVSAGGLYQVNERRPEVLSVAGRDYLMMGSQGGTVKPSAPAGEQRVVNLNVNVRAQPGMSRASAAQQGADIGRGIQQALARNG